MEIRETLFTEKVTIRDPIGNLYRKNHVLILVVNEKGNFLLGKKKDFYPSHIARMLGGAMNEGETPVCAAQREIREELSLNLPVTSFKPLCTVTTQAETKEGYMEMRTQIFSINIPDFRELKPSDDVSDLQTFTSAEYKRLVKSMEDLVGEYVSEKFSFLWSDWGKIYAPIHRHALEGYGAGLRGGSEDFSSQ